MENGRPVIAFYGGEMTTFRLDFENEESGEPVDLTGKAVTFSYRPLSGGGTTTVTATVTDPESGVARVFVDLSTLSAITKLTVYAGDIWIEGGGERECQGLVTMNILPAITTFD